MEIFSSKLEKTQSVSTDENKVKGIVEEIVSGLDNLKKISDSLCLHSGSQNCNRNGNLKESLGTDPITSNYKDKYCGTLASEHELHIILKLLVCFLWNL